MKVDEIINPIIDIFKIKEEFKRKQELKALDKPKKIKDEHYTPATKNKKYLLVCEGASAQGGLMPVCGREDFGYYTLKGKPLNSWASTQQKFTANKELSGLYQVIKNEGIMEDCPDGEWYKLEINGKEMIVNENDDVKINDKWVRVKSLLK